MVSSGNQRPSEKRLCFFFVRLKRCLKMHTQTNPNRMLLYITICVHELIYTLPTAIKTKGRQKRENLIPPCPPHLAVKTHSFVAAARYGRENFQCTQSPNFMIGNTLVLKVVIEWPSRLTLFGFWGFRSPFINIFIRNPRGFRRHISHVS